MATSVWPSHEPVFKASRRSFNHLLRPSPGSTNWDVLLSFQAIGRNCLNTFNFLGNRNCHLFLCVGYRYSRG